jgi:hypothetical protein
MIPLKSTFTSVAKTPSRRLKAKWRFIIKIVKKTFFRQKYFYFVAGSGVAGAAAGFCAAQRAGFQ